MENPKDSTYFSPRRCLRDPIPEILEAAELLSAAVEAHLSGNGFRAAEFILAADKPEIRDWMESLWGSRVKYPDKVHYLRIRPVPELEKPIATTLRMKSRRPDSRVSNTLIERFGWNCAYCGIPLIDRRARKMLTVLYPEALRWGRTNDSKHTAFMCMDNEFDHVVPHSRGGTNEFENLVPCCAPCNCGKEGWTLEQLGLIDPRTRERPKSAWDGLARVLGKDMN